MLKLTNISLVLINIHKQRTINIKASDMHLLSQRAGLQLSTLISTPSYRGSVRYAVGESSSFVTPIFAHS